eukprot:TRINITY_DN751_c0_g1_i1.p1 TRINITY_DN751_c0_g1~~TRINITY_DN751_c0_g1_i1.p1  ORF type:complete len:803 (-),score=169.99 TRINITY_DN751_c0_g1_i1:304-2712(-)
MKKFNFDRSFGMIMVLMVVVVSMFCSPVRGDDECDAPVDIMLVLDGSSSISRTNWDRVLAFSELVVRSYVFGTSANFGVTQFSSTELSTLEHGMSGDKESVLALIGSLVQQRSYTSISRGLDIGIAELLNNGRPGVKKMIILLTDGIQNQPGDPIASALVGKEAQIEIFAVTVSAAVDLISINSVVTTPAWYHVFSVLQFYELANIVIDINLRTCEASLAPLPPIPGVETSEVSTEVSSEATNGESVTDTSITSGTSNSSPSTGDTIGDSTTDTLVCDSEDLINYSPACNNQGYCLQEGPYFACSCMSQFNGSDCAVPTTRPECIPQQVLAIKSDLETEVQVELTGGQIRILVEGNLENNIYHDPDNYASWTEITMIQDQYYKCPYPQSSWWTKLFLEEGCDELYEFKNYFSVAKDCFELTCFDAFNIPLPSCDPVYCTRPPCEKSYKTTMNIERGYRRENGRLMSYDDSSNQFDIYVIYPWIATVTSGSGVTVSTNSDAQNNFLLRSADYDIETDLWNITILTSVLYPWRLGEGDDLRFGPYYGILSDDYSLCPPGAEECVQEIYVVVAGCDTFVEDVPLESSALLLTCNTLDIADCPIPGIYEIDLSVTVGATSSCTAEVDVGELTLDFQTYDAGYTDSRSTFIGGTENQPIYFKITATLDTDMDQVSSLNIISLTSTTASSNLVDEITIETCPEASDRCFYVPANTLSPETVADDVAAIRDIYVAATVEVIFANGAKRSLTRSLQELKDISLQMEMIYVNDAVLLDRNDPTMPTMEQETVDSSSYLMGSFLCIFVFLTF